MTDYFGVDARIDDRIEALARTLFDPFLCQATKVEEIASALDRIARLEASRPMAERLSVLADCLVPPGDTT